MPKLSFQILERLPGVPTRGKECGQDRGAAHGAAPKGNTLINYSGVSEDRIRREHPDYVVVAVLESVGGGHDRLGLCKRAGADAS